MTRRPSAATAPRGHVVPRGHVAPRRLPRAGVRVIERAVDLLLCFDEANERLTLQELSDRAGIHKATAFRILATLVADRILDQPAPGGPYELGFFALGRADAILGASVLRGRAVPIMLQLRDELDETVIFAERHGDRIVNLDKVASRQGVIAAPVVGIAEPLHESPAGLARNLSRTTITTFGHDFGVASTLFERPTAPGKIGRQMQTWVRFPEGWRVVAAHVSLIDR